jgi:hypothetical protein
MSRSLSALARRALYGAETGDVFLILLTLSHDDLPAPLRVCSDAVDVVSRGTTFSAFPFDLTLPDDDDNQSPQARLSVDNVDRQIVAAIRRIPTAPTVLIEIIRAADPDVVEAVFADFKLTDIQYDSQTVKGNLTIEDFTAEPFPAASFSPGSFPGLF